jgi:hypothetical protein
MHAALASALLRLLRQLYDRDCRRSFMGGAQAWFAEAERQHTIESLAQRMDPSTLLAAQEEPLELIGAAGGGGGSGGGGGGGGGLPLSEMPEARRVASLLLRMPFTLTFDSRLRVLRRWLSAERDERRDAMLLFQTPHVITVRR